jgi:hypothetical protein
VPPKIAVFGLIRHPHATAAQLMEDSVVRNGFAGDQQSAPKMFHRW